MQTGVDLHILGHYLEGNVEREIERGRKSETEREGGIESERDGEGGKWIKKKKGYTERGGRGRKCRRKRHAR